MKKKAFQNWDAFSFWHEAFCLGECLNELGCAEQVDHTLEVVGHGCEPDFGACSVETAQQQARMSEDAVLEGAEGMLDRGFSQLHERGCSALVHAVQRLVMEMARNHALRRGGALSLS